jgi:hypothetical protein
MHRRRRLVGFGSFSGLVAVIAVCGLIVSGSAQAAGSTTYDVGGSTLLTNITLNGVSGNALTVAPGTDVTIAANWSDHHTGCPDCVDFVDVAYAGSANAAGCIENGAFVGEGGSGSADLGDAPATPGTYDIIGEFLQVYNCGDGYGPNNAGRNNIGTITVDAPPTVTLTTPPASTATYTYGQVVDANYSCTAGAQSTLSTCVGTVANGSPINTSSVGSGQSFSVTATDADGLTTTVTHTYNVVATSTRLEAWPQLIEFEPFVGVGSRVVAATLTSGGSPVSGQTIYFTVGSTALCHATTNAHGYATCVISGADESLVTSINYYKASYSTTTDYTGSTATTPVVTLF